MKHWLLYILLFLSAGANAQFDINQIAEAEGKAAMNIRSGERGGAEDNENVFIPGLSYRLTPRLTI